MCTRSSVCTLWLLAWWFCRTPNCGNRCVSDSFACSLRLFPPIGLPCTALIGLIYCILLLAFGCCLLEACSFLLRERKGWIRREDVDRNWQEETVIRIYYVRITIFFQKIKQSQLQKNSLFSENDLSVVCCVLLLRVFVKYYSMHIYQMYCS